MPASAELVDLCQTHLELLRRTFGEVSSVIYLTLGVDSDSEPVLVPIAQIPESSDLNDLLNPMIRRGALPASDRAGMTMVDAMSSGELAGVGHTGPDIDSSIERLVLPL
ncbi:MAG: hypothetical protein AAFX51_16375, partial [Cyanobacteria bacterium J06636_28]